MVWFLVSGKVTLKSFPITHSWIGKRKERKRRGKEKENCTESREGKRKGVKWGLRKGKGGEGKGERQRKRWGFPTSSMNFVIVIVVPIVHFTRRRRIVSVNQSFNGRTLSLVNAAVHPHVTDPQAASVDSRLGAADTTPTVNDRIRSENWRIAVSVWSLMVYYRVSPPLPQKNTSELLLNHIWNMSVM